MTAKDEELQALTLMIKSGWPNDERAVPAEIRPFLHWRDELTVEKGIVYKGSRCVVPATMREDVLCRLHRAHLGLESCLRRAREAVFWPGINSDVKALIENCETCATLQRAQSRKTLHPHEVPAYPWEAVGVDLFMLERKDFLITVGYFSGYWEIDQLTSTPTAVVRCLLRHFARYGIPAKVVSDNEPEFSSTVFVDFAAEWALHIVLQAQDTQLQMEKPKRW